MGLHPKCSLRTRVGSINVRFIIIPIIVVAQYIFRKEGRSERTNEQQTIESLKEQIAQSDPTKLVVTARGIP